MSENRQKLVVQTYFKKVDSREFDAEYYALFTEDVELYFPKFGFGYGTEGLRKFGAKMSGFLESLSHDVENFTYIQSENLIAVEGTENGTLLDGRSWPDNQNSFGKFCNVFEFDGDLIKRMHIYADPDVASEDKLGISRLSGNNMDIDMKSIEEVTKEVVDTFYHLLSSGNTERIADLFADEVDWDLPGNTEKFEWVGKRKNKKEVSEFFQQLKRNIKSEEFKIDFIAIEGENAVGVGSLSSNILAYQKVFSSEITNIFKVRNGKIIKYHFIEDSYKLDKEMS